jgi:hypothetical protein
VIGPCVVFIENSNKYNVNYIMFYGWRRGKCKLDVIFSDSKWF